MTHASTVRTLTLACVLFAMWPSVAATAAAAPGDANQAVRVDALELKSAASALDRAAKVGKVPEHLSAPHISPALDAWISGGLSTARTEKKAAARAADLRAMATSLLS